MQGFQGGSRSRTEHGRINACPKAPSFDSIYDHYVSSLLASPSPRRSWTAALTDEEKGIVMVGSNACKHNRLPFPEPLRKDHCYSKRLTFSPSNHLPKMTQFINQLLHCQQFRRLLGNFCPGFVICFSIAVVAMPVMILTSLNLA